MKLFNLQLDYLLMEMLAAGYFENYRSIERKLNNANDVLILRNITIDTESYVSNCNISSDASSKLKLFMN